MWGSADEHTWEQENFPMQAELLFTSTLSYEMLLTYFNFKKVTFHVKFLCDLKCKIGLSLYPLSNELCSIHEQKKIMQKN